MSSGAGGRVSKYLSFSNQESPIRLSKKPVWYALFSDVPRETEVGKFQMSIATQQNVLRLEVTVHDFTVVEMLQSQCHLER